MYSDRADRNRDNSFWRAMQTEDENEGQLYVQVTSRIDNRPIRGASVTISFTGEPDGTVAELTTDESGQTAPIELETPPESYSLSPDQEQQPYAEYTIRVTAPGYESVDVSGSELFQNTTSIQPIAMVPITEGEDFARFVIDAHTLYGDYPAKIPEEEIKPVNETGEIVLSRVVVPEYVIVHDGAPSDSTAANYYVTYRDYIKNVACSEIYSTWPEAAIRANILAIMSFTLNRVYTEWYRNRGYDFTITSSTAYDHKWINGRNYFENVSRLVDEQFGSYLSRPNVKQPILTQYCDGERVTCPNWMSQWGSKSLADQGYTTIQILRYYYGSNLYINTAETIEGIPASWPGYDLTIGSSGLKVRQLQEQLNAIATGYPAVPTVAVDGIYGEATQNAVRTFQRIFGLPATGVTDYATWYRIQNIYVGVTQIAELI